MPYYSCPNCGSTVSSAVESAPGACPGCCATLRPSEDVGGDRGVTSRPERRPKPALRMSLGTGSDAPASARHALLELRGELGESRFRLCELLVSELVTNTVLHAPDARALPGSDMRVRLYRDRIRVEVRDDGPGFTPRPRVEGQDPGSGWGLHLVGELADEWGVEPGAQNCVWFEVGRTPVASGMHALAHA